MNWRENFAPDAVEVRVSELMVATADESDFLLDKAIPEVLRLLRDKMQMDVVFVSEFTGGERVFRHVDQTPGQEVIEAGGSGPLEASWCQRVVDGRLPEIIADAGVLQAAGKAPATPFPIGTHLSTPIVMQGGEVYGTLCCFSFGDSGHATEQDLRKLKYTAELTAAKIQRSRNAAAAMALEPMKTVGSGFDGRL